MNPKDFPSTNVPFSGNPNGGPTVLRYRTIWISDLHLGSHGCQAESILDFIKHVECDRLYLVGDIFDFWQLRKHWYWPQAHNDVVQKILRFARNGTHVTYIPGNHDEAVRSYCGLSFGGVFVTNEAIHTTLSGQRFLVVHGDQFDAFMYYAKWLAHLGNTAYVILLRVNAAFNFVRRKLGFSYWSLSAYLKHKVKDAVAYIGDFENFLAEEARRLGVDGIICGHIHQTDMRMIGPTLYCNDGDWVESCTALVEDSQGRLKLINWPKERDQLLQQAPVRMEQSRPDGMALKDA